MARKGVVLIGTILLVNLLTWTTVRADGPLAIIKNLLQDNVAGNPIVHKRTEYDFDPEVSQKRRQLFYEVNGFRAGKFIERIGVGEDGLEDERRVQQTIRDEGRLNGEHYINFP